MKAKLYTMITIVLLSSVTTLIVLTGGTRLPRYGSSGDAQSPDKDWWELMRNRDPKTGKIPANIHKLELEYVSKMPGAPGNIYTKYDKIQSTRWQRRGPWEIGGRTRALAIDVTNENIILAGGVSGGMWRSTDGGVSWNETSTPDQLHSVSCITQDIRPGKQNIWYYGTGEFWGNSAAINGDGMFKSTDGGLSWFALTSTSTNSPNTFDNKFEFVWNIIVNPAAPLDRDEVYACTALGGVYRTTDGGNKWDAVLGNYGNGYSYFTDIAISSKGIIYAALSKESNRTGGSIVHGLFRSVDGKTWTDITPADFPPEFKRVVIGIAPSDENQVWFVGDTPGYGKWTTNAMGDDLYHSLWKYTYNSGDGTGSGGKWDNLSANLPRPEKIRGHMNSQSGYDLVIKVHPNNPEVVYIAAVALYRSTDGWKSGQYSWIGGTCPFDNCDYDYRYDNHHSDIHAVLFLSSNHNIMYTGSDGGVHKTLNNMSDTVSWISLDNGYFTTQYYTVAINRAKINDYTVVGGLQDNGTLSSTSRDIMMKWANPSRGDGFQCCIPDNGKYYYTSQNSSYQPKIKIFRNVMGSGIDPVIQTRIDPDGGKDFIWNTPFLLDPNNNDIMYLAGGNIVWRNSALGSVPEVTTKDSISIGWDSLSYTRTTDKVTALGVSKSPSNILYYGTSAGNVYRIDNANTGNPAPKDISGNNFPKGSYVGCIAVDNADGNKVIVAFTNYNIISIFYTTDGGVSWTPVSGNLEETPNGSGSGPAVQWVVIMPVKGKNMYFAGTSAGLFSTAYLDGPFTVWQQEGAETIGNMVVDMLDCRASDGYIVAGTHGAGVFEAFISDLPAAAVPPLLVYPSNDAHAITDTANFSWQPVSGASFYTFQLATDNGFTNIVRTIDGIRDTKVFIDKLEQGYKKYYWRVFAKNSGGLSPSSDVWVINTAVVPPVLQYPAAGAVSVPVNTTFTWNPVAGAVKYHLQIGTNIFFAIKPVDTVVNASNLILPLPLDKNKKYQWHVSSIDQYGEGLFSQSNGFTTGDGTSVSSADNGTDVILYQNYPNPFSVKTNIDFIINKDYYVILTIYDDKGNLVKKPLDRYLLQGRHSIQLNASDYAGGAYFYRLSAGGKSITNSFVVVK